MLGEITLSRPDEVTWRLQGEKLKTKREVGELDQNNMVEICPLISSLK